MRFNFFQPDSEFLHTKCLLKVLFKGIVTLFHTNSCLSSVFWLWFTCSLMLAPSCSDIQDTLNLYWLRLHFYREKGLGCSKPASAGEGLQPSGEGHCLCRGDGQIWSPNYYFNLITWGLWVPPSAPTSTSFKFLNMEEILTYKGNSDLLLQVSNVQS